MGRNRPIFLNDDFFELKSELFDESKIYFNPGAIAPESRNIPSKLFQLPFDGTNLAKYHNDDTSEGREARRLLAELAAQFEGLDICEDNITLSPTVTTCSLITLQFLKHSGVKFILMETPCYYATLYQIKALQLVPVLIPTYCDNNFEWNFPNQCCDNQWAIWITQPRISLSLDQKKVHIMSLCKYVEKKNGYMVVDEATELKAPGVMSCAAFDSVRNRIIRLRSIFKPVGINGPRISYILHDRDISDDLKKWIWVCQGGIDWFSLSRIRILAEERRTIIQMYDATLNEVKHNYNKLRVIAHGSRVFLPPYENGYTSSIRVQLSNAPLNYEKYHRTRRLVVKMLEENNVFPTLGASMYIACDWKNEYIRINYLSNNNRLADLLECLIAMTKNLAETNDISV